MSICHLRKLRRSVAGVQPFCPFGVTLGFPPCRLAANVAKRMECVELAPAFDPPGAYESGSKLHALHTLRAAGLLVTQPRVLDDPRCLAYGCELDAALSGNGAPSGSASGSGTNSSIRR